MISSFADYIEHIESEDNSVFRCAITEAVPEGVLLQVIKERPDLKTWVVSNKLVPESVLVLLANDEDQDVRYKVATKRSAPLPILERLADDPVESVRRAVAHNARASKQILEKLAQDTAPEVVEKAVLRLKQQDYRL